MAKRASAIQQLITKVSKKEPVSIGIAVTALSPEQQELLQTTLLQLDKSTEKKEKNEETKAQSSDERHVKQFLARLRTKVNSIENEEVRVKTDYRGCKGILEDPVADDADETSLLSKLTKLEEFIGSVDVLKTMAIYRQATIVNILCSRYTRQEVEKLTSFNANYINKLIRFFTFASDYPLLLYTGYSFETLMHHKKHIESEMDQDENLRCKLATKPTITYQYETEDMIADKMEEALLGTDT